MARQSRSNNRYYSFAVNKVITNVSRWIGDNGARSVKLYAIEYAIIFCARLKGRSRMDRIGEFEKTKLSGSNLELHR